MNGKGKIVSFLVILGVIVLLSDVAMPSIIFGGSERIEDRGWPSGCVEMANLATRFGWWEGPPLGGGEYHFLYRCQNTDEFNKALKIFAAIRAPKLELVVHNGPEYSFWLKKDEKELSKPENRVDWTFLVWVPENWNRLFNSPRSYMLSSDHPNFKKPVAAPMIDVYIGGGGFIVWEDVKVPENIVVIDKRPGSVSPEFADGGLVRGKVLDMVTGQLIAGAEIVLATYQNQREWKEEMRGTTNHQGLCQIAKIPPGYYEVRVIAKGYVPRKQGNYDNKRPEYHQFEIDLTRPSYVKGIVTDPNGNPIQGVKVTAINIIGSDGFGYPCVDDKSAITDKDGRFNIRSLPIGLTNIMCHAESLHLKNSILEQYPIPSDEIKLTMTGTGIVQGKVVDKDGKTLSRKVHVHIRPPGEQIDKWGGSCLCEEDGSFEFTGVPPGEYLVGTDWRLLTEGDKTNAKLMSVEAGKTYEIEILYVEQEHRR